MREGWEEGGRGWGGRGGGVGGGREGGGGRGGAGGGGISTHQAYTSMAIADCLYNTDPCEDIIIFEPAVHLFKVKGLARDKKQASLIESLAVLRERGFRGIHSW